MASLPILGKCGVIGDRLTLGWSVKHWRFVSWDRL